MKRFLFISIILISYFVLSSDIKAQSWINSFSPSFNALNVDISSNITAQFKEPLDQTSLNTSSIRMWSNRFGYLDFIIIYDDVSQTLTLDPINNFIVGDLVTVTFTTEIKNVSNENMPNSLSYQFFVTNFSNTATYQGSGNVSVVGDTYSIVTFDADNDGDLDLAVTNISANLVTILKNSGTGKFTLMSTVNVLSSPSKLATGDFDSDGNVDLVVTMHLQNRIKILWNNNGAFVSSITPIEVGAWPEMVTTGDMDGDGDIDIITANRDDGTLSICKNDGSGIFTISNTEYLGYLPRAATVIDLENDGDFDLVSTNHYSNDFTTLTNDGNVLFAIKQNLRIGQTPQPTFAGDFDSDGFADLVIACQGADFIRFLKNDGTGLLEKHTRFFTGDNPASMTICDVDGDGDIDVAENNIAAGNFSIFLNDGAGSFSNSGTYTAGTTPSSITNGDFDGDGDLDLAVSLYGKVRIYKNLTTVGNLTIGEDTNLLPGEFRLDQNYPNPFNPSTSINFDLPVNANVRLSVFNSLAEEIAVLIDNEISAGTHSFNFNAENISSGIYFYRINVESENGDHWTESKKMILMK